MEIISALIISIVYWSYTQLIDNKKIRGEGGIKVKRLLYLLAVLLYLGVFAVHFTVYQAYAEDNQPAPAPAEGTTVKGSKSNSDNRQIQPTPAPGPVEGTINTTKSNTFRQVQPTPEPAGGTTVKSTKSNTSERQVQPTPIPSPAEKVKGSKSNSSE
jgi:hypothetical protein